jgi:hypothetical protein
MTPREQANCEALRKNFEGRDAIYLEKGVLRVRVQNIFFDLDATSIHAVIEEIPTPGLHPSLFYGKARPWSEPGHPPGRYPGQPLRWNIGAGDWTTFSASSWTMGYGGWSLFFEPGTIDGLIALAREWPDELGVNERYNRSLKFLYDRPMSPQQLVFCDQAILRQQEEEFREELRQFDAIQDSLDAQSRQKRGCGNHGACAKCGLTYAFDGLWCSHCNWVVS